MPKTPRKNGDSNRSSSRMIAATPQVSIDRRSFLAGLTVATAVSCRPGSPEAPQSPAVKLGVASYSLRKFSLGEAIAMIQKLKTPYVNIKSYHLPYEASSQELAAGRAEIEQAGLQIVGGGTITLKKDDDADIRRHFEYAKNCGMPLMVIAPTPETVPRIERFIKEYDIKAAIHNHGPEDEYFPTPRDALEVVRELDPRFGLCIDVGHTARTGVDVVGSIAEAGPRLLDMHMKDLASFEDPKSQCAVGEGLMPVEKIFRQLQAMTFQGFVNLEYEIFSEDPLPGMQQSFAFMREVLRKLPES